MEVKNPKDSWKTDRWLGLISEQGLTICDLRLLLVAKRSTRRTTESFVLLIRLCGENMIYRSYAVVEMAKS